MSEWISVFDQEMPQTGEKFLAYRPRPDTQEGYDVNVCWFKADIFGSYGFGGHGWSYPFINMPTHWMPLPEPPK